MGQRVTLSAENGRTIRLGEAILVVGWVLVAALFVVDAFVAPDGWLGDPGELLPGWDPTRFDWLTLFATVLGVAVLVPWLQRPERVRAALARYPNGVVPRGALGVLCLTLLVAFVGPLIVAEPVSNLQETDQPPVGVGVPTAVAGDCVGPAADGVCRGSLAHPFGTTRGGADVFAWIVHGTRTVVQFVLVAAAITTPLGVGVGLAAGYLGGRVDTLVTAYADLQQTVPTVVIYVLVVVVTNPSLFALVAVYGLFNWGQIARLVRSRALTVREEAYVEAAESAGAGRLYTLRHHLLPNVAGTAITAVSLAVPKLILIEVALSFVSLGGEGTFSWGQLLQRGFAFALNGPRRFTIRGNVETLWWVPVVPAVVTAIVVLAASLVGDAVQSASDPTGE